jgi:hypothetical protein
MVANMAMKAVMSARPLSVSIICYQLRIASPALLPKQAKRVFGVAGHFGEKKVPRLF